ncbi:Rv3235 family protein [Alloactinosynnema sp. L-07]|uniref:Rv3235 family protein n=1 Tax=Alloactinosynnema sp. L-07 TaxID=1653480 RepID=UPI0006B43113|nr:Rv3235 family protein [Alloactinosynnema sp. L-07]
MHVLAEYEPPYLGEAEEFRWRIPPPRPPAVVRVVPFDAGPSRATLARLFGLVFEAMEGRRPVAQLSAIMSPQVHAAMTTRTRATAGHRFRLLRLHPCRVAADAVEVSATVDTGRRVVAVAARLERDGDWRFTCLRFLTTKAQARPT